MTFDWDYDYDKCFGLDEETELGNVEVIYTHYDKDGHEWFESMNYLWYSLPELEQKAEQHIIESGDITSCEIGSYQTWTADIDEIAKSILMKCSNLDENAAEWVITYLADDPIKFAYKYGYYLDQVSSDEVEDTKEWYGEDNIFEDAAFEGAIRISDTPVCYY